MCLYIYIYIYLIYACVRKGSMKGKLVLLVCKLLVYSKAEVAGEIGAGGQIFKPTCQPVSALKEKAI